jgi:hypothetical protein
VYISTKLHGITYHTIVLFKTEEVSMLISIILEWYTFVIREERGYDLTSTMEHEELIATRIRTDSASNIITLP